MTGSNGGGCASGTGSEAGLRRQLSQTSADRVANELAELRGGDGATQYFPPSAWLKREHKYRQDLEKYQHTMSMQQQRIAKLEQELGVLREGVGIRPLEEKIEELEQQLKSTAEEKVQVQSKFHELSIKHRQLIETSPALATIWHEALVQQQRAGCGAATAARLTNFDLRHTGAAGALEHALAAVRRGGGGSEAPPGLPALRTDGKAGVGPGAGGKRAQQGSTWGASAHGLHASSDGSVAQQPGTPLPESEAARAAALRDGDGGSGGGGGGGGLTEGLRILQSAEERAAALMASVELEGLTPEAQVAALQQLNYDLTMQLELYQHMLMKLKDKMEEADLEKAELEADKFHLEARFARMAAAAAAAASAADAAPSELTASGAVAALSVASRRWGSGLLSRWRGAGLESREDSPQLPVSRDSSVAGPGRCGGGGSGAAARGELGTASSGLLSSSAPADVGGGRGRGPSGGGALDDGMVTPRTLAATGIVASRARMFGIVRTRSGGAAPQAGDAAGAAPQAPKSAAQVAKDAAGKLAAEAEEARRHAAALEAENMQLVESLVKIKMELADMQGDHFEAKRALVRATDREACLEMKVQELQNMLDMVTSLQQAPTADGRPRSRSGCGSASIPIEEADEEGECGGGNAGDEQQHHHQQQQQQEWQQQDERDHHHHHQQQGRQQGEATSAFFSLNSTEEAASPRTISEAEAEAADLVPSSSSSSSLLQPPSPSSGKRKKGLWGRRGSPDK